MEKITLTPKEKAEELLNKMLKNTTILVGSRLIAKEQSVIAVSEMLEVLCTYQDISKDYQYWNEVKQEIEKI